MVKDYQHDWTMSDNDRTIDGMDVSDSMKQAIYGTIIDQQEKYLETIGHLIDTTLDCDRGYYVEHTNQGLNLRFVETENVDEIVAIAEGAGLTTIERSRTNENSKYVWLRFKLLNAEHH